MIAEQKPDRDPSRDLAISLRGGRVHIHFFKPATDLYLNPLCAIQIAHGIIGAATRSLCANLFHAVDITPYDPPDDDNDPQP